MVVLNREPASSKLPVIPIEEETNVPKMSAKAVLICRPNSHPFQDRTLLLDQPVKVGRSVARARPASANAIFDCKVLSRNHALLWYDNGKFYLQDTKSSNGSFVNNQRLSKGSEESAPREVCSGDIVQFGVDVMENSRTGKVTHGCIVATLKIYLPDGKEAKASPSTAMLPNLPASGAIPTQELYQLAQYLQEALHREEMLESKLTMLQKLVANSQEASESGWKALIDEDKLFTRLEILESQLQTYSKNFQHDKFRDEVSRLQDDKQSYQQTAKESLRKVLQEKLEAVKVLQDMERNLTAAGEESKALQATCERTQQELQELAVKYSNQQQEIQDLTEMLQEAEEKYLDQSQKAEEEQKSLFARLEAMKNEEDSLQAKIESLKADNDFSQEQLASMKARLELGKIEQMDGEIIPKDFRTAHPTESRGIQVDILLEKIEGEMEDNLKGALRQTQDDIDKLKKELLQSEKDLKQSKARVNELQAQIVDLKSEDERNVALIKKLQEEIKQLEENLKQAESEDFPPSPLLIVPRNNDQNHQQQLQANGIAPAMHQLNHIGEPEANLANTVRVEIDKLKELLMETREKKKFSETEVLRLKGDLEEAKNTAQKGTEEVVTLKQQLQQAQQQAKDKSDFVTKLQEQLNKAEVSAKDVRQQIGLMKDRLAEEQQRYRAKQEEADHMRQKLEDEMKSHQKTIQLIEEYKKQLQAAQQNNKQSHNEAEQLRNKIKGLTEELERKSGNGGFMPDGSPHPNILDNKSSEVLQSVRQECSSLKNRIQTTEAEMRKARSENAKLHSDYKKLQEAYTELDALKQRLELPQRGAISNDPNWEFNDDFDDGVEGEAMKHISAEVAEARRQLAEAQIEIMQLKIQFTQCNDERARLKADLESTKEDYNLLSYQTRTISACAMLPLILLLLAIMLAFYPTLASVTATSEARLPP